jgi:hypothetical protein
MRRILRLGLVFAATAVAAVGQAQSPVTRESRPVRLLRTWHDPLKTPQGDVWRRVELVYDYAQAAAFERVYTMEGRLVRNRRIVVNPPAPSQEEIEEAFRIVRADVEMARILQRFGGHLEGGFLIEEGRGKPCGPGARCLLIQILSPDRTGLVRVMGIDLVRRTIPYRTFIPSEHPGVK